MAFPALLLVLIVLPTPAIAATDSDPWFEQLTDRARELAGQPYEPPDAALPQALETLDYDRYRSIRFRPEAALWRNEALFEIQLFHPGFLYREPVPIHRVQGSESSLLDFDPARFRYDGPAAGLADALGEAPGHAGFRVHYPLNRGDYKDELAVFLGASYFRLLGRGQVYGLSARGLAIDTARPGHEEFPVFREFWLIEPEPDATRLEILALLDSPSVAGAYRFELTPGSPTTLTVDARLFARRTIERLGVAPLTSMFLHGDTPGREPDDFRPRVHDSDGLLMHTSAGEWIWRPLTNRQAFQVTSLRDDQPHGFGLLQRERDFAAYRDLEAQYHRRPSLWVEALDGDWGSGGVELVEIPTDTETMDNIVAYWAPDQPFPAGTERRYQYRLISFDERLPEQTLARVERTGIGWGAIPGQSEPPPRSLRQFSIDFQGGALAALDASQPVEALLSHSAGEVRDLMALPLPEGRGWRAAFKLHGDDRPVDLQLFLSLRGQRLSETWSYLWHPRDSRR